MTSGGPERLTAGPDGDRLPARRRPAAYDPADPAELVVLVAAGCRSSQRSVRELEVLAAMRPDARVAVLDVAGPHRLPVSLIGTPTWVWQGRARWWGTPDLAEVLAVLDASTRAQPPHGGNHDDGEPGDGRLRSEREETG